MADKGCITRRGSADGTMKNIYDIAYRNTVSGQYLKVATIEFEQGVLLNLSAGGTTAIEALTLDDILDITDFNKPTDI